MIKSREVKQSILSLILMMQKIWASWDRYALGIRGIEIENVERFKYLGSVL